MGGFIALQTCETKAATTIQRKINVVTLNLFENFNPFNLKKHNHEN